MGGFLRGVTCRPVLVVAAAALAAGCAAGTGTTSATDGAGGEDPPAPPEPVTIAFVGDIHDEGQIGSADPTTVLDGVRPALDEADLVVGNLETAVTERGRAANKKYVFRASESFVTGLRTSGVDVVSVANNHGMDFGETGLEDTLAAEASTGMPMIGVGRDATEAFAPYSTEINGQRIAIIGATQVLDAELMRRWTATDSQAGLASAFEEDRLLAAVRQAKTDHDVVVVFLHWGSERRNCPNQRQLDLMPQLKEAGAQIIVGSHAHVLLGGGYDGDTYVNYGLGNFLFYSGGRGDATVETGVQLVTVEDGKVTGAQWRPGKIQNNDLPELYEGEDAEKKLEYWEDRRECTGLSATPG